MSMWLDSAQLVMSHFKLYFLVNWHEFNQPYQRYEDTIYIGSYSAAAGQLYLPSGRADHLSIR